MIAVDFISRHHGHMSLGYSTDAYSVSRTLKSQFDFLLAGMSPACRKGDGAIGGGRRNDLRRYAEAGIV